MARRWIGLALCMTIAGLLTWDLVREQHARRLDERLDAEFARVASATALGLAADPARAKVMSVRANAGGGEACGWMDSGGDDGVVPFYVRVDGETSGDLLVSLPTPGRRDLETRVLSATAQRLLLARCGRTALLPPRPAAARPDAPIDAAVAQMIDGLGRWWTVVPAAPAAGFVGVERLSGGYLAIGPVMPTWADARAWAMTPDKDTKRPLPLQRVRPARRGDGPPMLVMQIACESPSPPSSGAEPCQCDDASSVRCW